jgi:hypothetical protein
MAVRKLARLARLARLAPPPRLHGVAGAVVPSEPRTTGAGGAHGAPWEQRVWHEGDRALSAILQVGDRRKRFGPFGWRSGAAAAAVPTRRLRAIGRDGAIWRRREHVPRSRVVVHGDGT